MMITEEKYNANQDKIAKSIIRDIYDMDKDKLFDLHVAFCVNAYFSMQVITSQDLSEEFIKKHKELAKKINKNK